jgi:hypothetical protein
MIPEIVDRAVTITVRRWRTLTAIVLIQAIPLALVETFGPAYANLWTTINVVFLTPLLAAAVIVTATAPEMPSAGSALGKAAHRFPSLVIGLLLSLLIALVGIAIIGIPIGLLFGLIGAGFGLPGVVFFASVGFAIAFPLPNLVIALIDPIIMLENATAVEAAGIAFRRARNAGWWRSWRLGLTCFAFDLLPTFALSSAGEQIGRLLHLPVVNVVFDLLTSGVTLGIGIVVATVISLEMRVRYDGTDLIAALRQADAPVDGEQLGIRHDLNSAESSATINSAGSE